MGEVLPESGIRNPVRESGFGKRFGSAARELTEREERLIEHKVRKKKEKETHKHTDRLTKHKIFFLI